MSSEKVPQTHLPEGAELLAEAHRLFARAVSFATRTSSIKVWVPLVCSCVLTIYYVYTLHRKSTTFADVPQTIAEAPAKPVLDTPAPQPTSTSPSVIAASTTSDGGGDDYLEMEKQAEQAHASQQFGDEARLWQTFIERSPFPQRACPAIGKAYERVGALDKAITAYEKCASLDPANLDILIAYAHALQAKSNFSRAADLYRQVVARDPKNMDARTGLALIALRENRLNAADEIAKGVLHDAPDNTDALLISGIVAWRERKLQDAEEIFLRGVGIDAQRADFHSFLGRIAEAERRTDEALRQYEKALALDPNDSDIAERRDRLQGVR